MTENGHTIDEVSPLVGNRPQEYSTGNQQQFPETGNGEMAERSDVDSRRHFLRKLSNHWIPSPWDVTSVVSEPILKSPGHPTTRTAKSHHKSYSRQARSLKRRVFLCLTEPDTSIASAVFFFVLVISITLMNVVMMMQTMQAFQFTPTDCRTCGGPVTYLFDDDNFIAMPDTGAVVECVCPPTPLGWTVTVLNAMVYFFTLEWTLRVLTFEPPLNEKAPHGWGFVLQWLGHLTSTSTMMDALAIFPYYMELTFETNGLMSLRLLRLFRVFQLVRLGQYNSTFTSLINVLSQSLLYLKLLLGVLLFGAAFFGSMLYWLEKGDWEYFEGAQSYQFVRYDRNHEPEVSPFTSIPETFWWFLVTATSVGYGDTVPTTTAGKWVGVFAMLTSVLVIAFPVSVFSELWQKELRKTGALQALEEDDDDDDEEHLDPMTLASSRANTFSDSDIKLSVIPETYPPPEYRRQPQGSLESMDNESSSSLFCDNGDYVRIHKDDLADLLSHVQSIRESQRQIRTLMRKYSPKTAATRR